ncbi:MAG: hypothetical protein JWO60_348 [Frankiales bacterium]|nr:hypothetical protein [Frankiales bacterium]
MSHLPRARHRARGSHGRFRARRAAAVSALVALLVALGAAPAWAHAGLVHTDPHDGSVLEYDPGQVVLTFNEPVAASLGAVRVVGPDGRRVDRGTTTRRAGGTEVVAAVETGLAHGTYAVLWRVVSEDSHPVSGVTTFSVFERTPAAAAQRAGQDQAGGAAGVLLRASRGVLYAGLILLLGVLGFVLALWHDGRDSRRVRRLLWSGWTLTAVATAAGLLLQGPYAAGLPVSQAFSGVLLQDVLPTRFGQASAARLALLLPMGAVLLALRRAPRTAAAAITGVTGTGLLLTTSATGHAVAGDLVALSWPLDAVHLAAVSLWLGGLIVLLAAVLPAQQPNLLAAVLPRWSRLAEVSVAVIVATGLFASWREVRSLDALPGTTYGQLLLVKTALVVAMIALGAAGRAFVRRHYTRTVVHASTLLAAPERPAPAPGQVDRLRTGVLLEAALAVVVLAVTAVLVETDPARVAYAPVFSQTADVNSAGQPLRVQADVEPATAGINAVHVYYTGTGSLAVDVPEVSARLISTTGETVPVALPRKSLGHYEQLTVPLSSKGRWRLEIRTRTSDIDTTTTSFTVPVH